jgi:hypothetical protein
MPYPRPDFTEPSPHGYLYLGWRIDPPAHAPFVRRSTRRRAVLEECRRLAAELEERADVVAATVYEAVVIVPVKGSPRFDVIMLVRTTSPQAIPTVETTADLTMPATNIRRIGNVDDQPRSGTFLFNHFTAGDPERALRVWDDVAGWFTHKAGVSDSALLRPTEEGPYVLVNHVRLPGGPLAFLLNFARPSFRKTVAARLRANKIGNAPVICRPM